MQNLQDAFETRKQSFISAFSVCMTVPWKHDFCRKDFKLKPPLKHKIVLAEDEALFDKFI